MKVTLYANTSANGKILLSGHEGHRIPPEVIGIALKDIIQAGNLVMGRKSYENFEKAFGGITKVKEALPNVELVSLSTTQKHVDGYTIAASPEEAIQHLAKKGYPEILIGGGTESYNAFLEKDLLTDIVFNILPILTAGGILITDDALTLQYKLVKHTLLTDNIIQLRYARE